MPEREMTLSERLSAPFPEESHKILKKGGSELTYIPVSEVVARLNNVFGVERWSHELVWCQRDATDPEWVVAKVRIIASVIDPLTGAPNTIIREGVGGQKIKAQSKDGKPVDLGDEFKGAASDALKKAATLFGVGLYLARDEDAMLAEEEAREEAQRPEPSPLWGQFLGLVKQLDPDGKAALNEFWKSHAGDRPKPTEATSASQEGDLEALIGECTRLIFNGQYVDQGNAS